MENLLSISIFLRQNVETCKISLALGLQDDGKLGLVFQEVFPGDEFFLMFYGWKMEGKWKFFSMKRFLAIFINF